MCAGTAATRIGHLWGHMGRLAGPWLASLWDICQGLPCGLFCCPPGGPHSPLIPSFPVHLKLWQTGERQTPSWSRQDAACSVAQSSPGSLPGTKEERGSETVSGLPTSSQAPFSALMLPPSPHCHCLLPKKVSPHSSRSWTHSRAQRPWDLCCHPSRRLRKGLLGGQPRSLSFSELP